MHRYLQRTSRQLNNRYWHDISTSTQLAKTEGLLNDHSATILLSLENHGAAKENEYKRPAGDKLAGKRFCH